MPSPTYSSEIDSVDAADHPIGLIRRGEALARGANFRTCHVFVFDRYERLLLQRLAMNRDRFPGRWGSSVAGYLHAGERYAEAARRRMWEEIGIDAGLHYVGRTKMADEGSGKFVALFTARADQPENGAPEQIGELRYWPLTEIKRTLRDAPNEFTPTFVHLFGFYAATLTSLGQAI